MRTEALLHKTQPSERTTVRSPIELMLRRVAPFGIVTIAILFFIIEYRLFRTYLCTYVTPYYPINDDQIGTYLSAYNIYFEIKSRGLGCLFSDPSLIRSCAPMKGALIPMLGVVANFLQGPSRVAIASVNFAFFLLGQCALVSFCIRRFGRIRASLVLGIFLTSFTLYFKLGGISDLRFDFAGMIVAGLCFFAVCNVLKDGCKVDFVFACAGFMLAAVTRSILLFYWIGTIAVLTVFFALFQKFDKSNQSKALMHRSIILFGITASILALHFGLHWQEFSAYYLLGKDGSEAAIRLHEYGLKNRVDLLWYYVGTFWNHFSTPINLSMFLSAMGLTGALFLQSKNSEVVGLSIDRIVALVSAAFALAVFGLVTAYHPSPLAVGVLCIPFSVFLGSTVHRAILHKGFAVICSVVALIAGCVTYEREMQHPTSIPHPVALESLAIDILHSKVLEAVESKSGKPCFVFFLLPHSALNLLVSKIKWYETRKTQFPSNTNTVLLPSFPATSRNVIFSTLEKADVVVAPTVLPKVDSFEYAAISATRTLLPEVKVILDREFRPVQEFPVGGPGWKMAVFVRRE